MAIFLVRLGIVLAQRSGSDTNLSGQLPIDRARAGQENALDLAEKRNVREGVVRGAPEVLAHATYHPTTMQIRPATEEDLDDIARIFDLASGWLTEKYRPDQVDRPFPGAASRDALYR